MLTYNIADRGKLPLYEFLYRSIRNDILSGKLKNGEKLPSKRSLSEHLQISVVTVEHAYLQLLDEGYIKSFEKKGYFVDSVEKDFITQSSSFSYKRKEEKSRNKYLIDFTSNNTPPEDFPFSVWNKTMRKVISENYENILDAVEFNGLYDLRRAIAEHLFHFRGMDVNPDSIVIGAGGEYIYNLLTALFGKSRIFGVEDPGYLKISKIYEMNGINCRTVCLDKYGVSMESVKKNKIDVLHISPSHHFPSGIVSPIGRRQELIRWANENDGYIIEDDFDSEFRFNGSPPPTLSSIDKNERVVYANTFSKTLAPSIRIGYMILSENLMKKYRETMSFLSCPVPCFEQHALASFISNGDFERHINRMKTKYKSRRDKVISAVKNSKFYDKVKIEEENAGLHFILKIDTQIPDYELKRKIQAAGINVSFLTDYMRDATPEYERQAIINYSGADLSRLDEAIEALNRVFERQA